MTGTVARRAVARTVRRGVARGVADGVATGRGRAGHTMHRRWTWRHLGGGRWRDHNVLGGGRGTTAPVGDEVGERAVGGRRANTNAPTAATVDVVAVGGRRVSAALATAAGGVRIVMTGTGVSGAVRITGPLRARYTTRPRRGSGLITRVAGARWARTGDPHSGRGAAASGRKLRTPAHRLVAAIIGTHATSVEKRRADLVARVTIRRGRATTRGQLTNVQGRLDARADPDSSPTATVTATSVPSSATWRANETM